MKPEAEANLILATEVRVLGYACPREGGAAMAWNGCAGINLSIHTSPVGGMMRLLPYRCLDGDDPGEGFADATCMMSPHGTAWRRQKEEAGAERGFHFQAMRQHVGLVVCLGSCEGLGRGPWKADGVGRIVNQVVLGPGRFWGSWLLMAWGADGWLPFDSLCGNLWILVMAMAGFTPWQLLLRIWCDFLFITELAGQ